MASVRGPMTWTRYIPTLRMPRLGSFEITIGSVMYAPPSSGQQVMIGSFERSTSFPLIATSCDAALPLFTRGGNFPSSSSLGSIDNLPMIPSGTLRSSISVIRSPTSSRSSTPSASDIRRIEPKRLITTGYCERSPLSRTTFSKKSALPPPGCFITLSATSQSSRRAFTGSLIRVSSPVRSIADRNCEMLSRLISYRNRALADVDGSHSKRQTRPRHAREARRFHSVRKLFFDRKVRDRARQVCVGRPMPAHQSADQREHVAEIEQIE